MKVYLCGGITGHPNGNREEFERAAEYLRTFRIEVVSPIELDDDAGILPDPEGKKPDNYRELLLRDLEIVADPTVDAIVTLPGWTTSPGARVEVGFASALGKPVWDEDDAIGQVIDGPLLQPTAEMRTFTSGATRDVDQTKPDYEGFLSPLAIEAFGRYMHKHRHQSDGTLRASDNWQKGIPRDEYMKSAWRHFMDWWYIHRGWSTEVDVEEALCAVLFNAQGYLHEHLADS